MSPEQRADALVEAFCEKSPLSKKDAIALRSSIAQQIAQAVAEVKGGDRQ